VTISTDHAAECASTAIQTLHIELLVFSPWWWWHRSC